MTRECVSHHSACDCREEIHRQERALLHHALGELREVSDLLQLQHPGNALIKVRGLSDRLFRHLKAQDPTAVEPEAS